MSLKILEQTKLSTSVQEEVLDHDGERMYEHERRVEEWEVKCVMSEGYDYQHHFAYEWASDAKFVHAEIREEVKGDEGCTCLLHIRCVYPSQEEYTDAMFFGEDFDYED